jgi:CheY-like chemotaxis protein
MRQSALEIDRMDFAEASRRPNDLWTAPAGPRLLIADDDPSILGLLADHCARLGFDVDTASNGMQAILKASRGKPDLIVVDVNMPEVDGLSVCAHLLEPERAPVNAIVITGSRNPHTLERCEGFGAQYVRKGPNFWSELESALAEFHPHIVSGNRQPMPPSPEVRSRPSVLLVDDDDDVHHFLNSRLEKCGLTVRHASDAQQAYRMVCKEQPAVIVTDYFMPAGDASYLLTRLRTTPATAKIPVIVLSGRKLNPAVKQDLVRQIHGHAGAAEIVSKSEPDMLFAALNKFCGFERGVLD